MTTTNAEGTAEPRFYVRQLTGYPIDLRTGARAGTEKVTYFIIDSLYNCRVIETWDWNPCWSHRTRERRCRNADARCAELNRWWELELAR